MSTHTKLSPHRNHFHPTQQTGPDGTLITIDQIAPWSTHPYTWTCPLHPYNTFTATPNQIVRAKQPIHLSACRDCVEQKHTLTWRNPALAEQAHGWNPADHRIVSIHRHPLLWTCPHCGDTVAATLATLTRGAPIEEATTHEIVKRCTRCSKPTLLRDYPHLAAQFVSTSTGETDPGLVVHTHRETVRDTGTRWQCHQCGTTFTMAVNSAIQVAAGTTLHMPCRETTRQRKLEQSRRAEERKELKRQAAAEAKLEKARKALAAAEEQARQARLAKQRRLSALKKQQLAKKRGGDRT